MTKLDGDAVSKLGKFQLARLLSELEQQWGRHKQYGDYAGMLDDCLHEGTGHVVGFTGPPGVGKSTLTGQLVKKWREQGKSVSVLAIDPSSHKTRGALLGDRTRMDLDADDDKIFTRSLAARDRLGGLSEFAILALVVLRRCFDKVLLETVGIGQSETEISYVADTVVYLAQPGSGDSLQYMKAGVMEVPDICVVTKADLGPLAQKTSADLQGALGITGKKHGWNTPVLLVSVAHQVGLDELCQQIDSHGCGQTDHNQQRHQLAQHIMNMNLTMSFGKEGIRALQPYWSTNEQLKPFAAVDELTKRMRQCLASLQDF